jgi:hypothetical protein
MADLRTLVDHSAACACPNLLLGGTNDEKLVQPYARHWSGDLREGLRSVGTPRRRTPARVSVIDAAFMMKSGENSVPKMGGLRQKTAFFSLSNNEKPWRNP